MIAFDAYEPVTLRAAAFVLEPLEAAHADEVFPALCNAEHYRFLPQDPPPSSAALRERYHRLESRRSPDGRELWLNWLIRLNAGEAAGLVQATVQPTGSAAVAYELFAPFHGRGIATEALRVMLLHLRDALRLTKATALVDTRNLKSIALLERLRFERAGFIKDADFFKGAASDEFGYELDLAQLVP